MNTVLKKNLQIKAERIIIPGGLIEGNTGGDPNFAYFGERLGLTNNREIKQILSASHAEVRITIKTTPISIERIWLNTENKFPYLIIAIQDGLKPEEIEEMVYARI